MAGANRNRGARQKRTYGTISPAREMWVALPRYEVVVYRNPPDDDETFADPSEFPEAGLDRIRLSIHFGGRGGTVNLNLTALTEPELAALRTVVDQAFDLAAPVCAELDKRAKAAFEEGNDTHARIYRRVPEVVVRQRPERQHDSSVPSRPGGVSGLDQFGLPANEWDDARTASEAIPEPPSQQGADEATDH